MSAEIYERWKHLLLVEENVRQELLNRHEWVFHDTSYNAIQDIRRTKLEARDPGVIDPDLLCVIDKALGREARCVVCLKPAASPVASSSSGPQVRLALCGKDVPARLGVDWSNDATTLEINRLLCNVPLAEAFVRVVEAAGSFVSYDPIQPSMLRICVAGTPDSDPVTWPLLVDLQNDADITCF